MTHGSRPRLLYESTMTDPRLNTLCDWLKGLQPSWQLDLDTLAPASADASFRRYFRIESKNPDFGTLIIMDAPPQHEPLDAFIQVDFLLSEAGLNAPKILKKILQRAFFY